jgi:hypothetical protein
VGLIVDSQLPPTRLARARPWIAVIVAGIIFAATVFGIYDQLSVWSGVRRMRRSSDQVMPATTAGCR